LQEGFVVDAEGSRDSWYLCTVTDKWNFTHSCWLFFQKHIMSRKCKKKAKINIGRARCRCYCLSQSQAPYTSE